MTTTPQQQKPPASLFLYLAYRDATAALGWLGTAFGFEITMSAPDDKGGVAHAELRVGDASIIVFSDDDGCERPPRRGFTIGFGAYLCLAEQTDVDQIHARAVAAGAVSVWQPESTEWGNYRCRVVDPEGYEWTFGTHRPGEPTGDWSDDDA
ncbi:MAG: glyoxalase [Streptosporangiales bacterium]|nr:glyoxalase [Streptosporangiales bacterium]